MRAENTFLPDTKRAHDDTYPPHQEPPAPVVAGEKTFFGHPRMLANLFSVEMWERFSFYGMQAIMVYYLYLSVSDGGLGLPQAAATGVMGAYGGMVYLFAILGGFLGDRMLGPERTLFYSAIMIMAGHIGLALIPGVTGVVVGLVLVAIGSGCLKTNASVLVGSLYSEDDPRRDGGYTIFYMGVNTGALLGPLLTGLLQSRIGFHYGFGLAAVGMAIGLLQYGLTRKNLPDSVHRLSSPLNRRQKQASLAVALLVVAIVVTLVAIGAITADNIANWVLWLVAAFTVVLFAVMFSSQKTTAQEHSRLISFIPMFLGNVVFFALFQQQFTVLAVYSESRVNWHIGNIEFPYSWFNAINPVFILLLGTVFTALWTKLGDRQPSTPQKFSIALGFIGLAFLTFLTQAGNTNVNVLWLVFIIFLCTLGELSISPVGMSLTSKLAPQAHRVLMMALYFCSISLGTTLAGWLAQFYSLDNEVAYFGWLGAASIAAGAVMFLLNRWILRTMAGVR